jgi:hypothetical protein
MSEAPDFGRCYCHDVREWNASGSIFGSIASFGGECGVCIAYNDWYQEEARREALSPQERIREDIAGRWFHAVHQMPDRRPGAPNPWGTDAFGRPWGEPPF